MKRQMVVRIDGRDYSAVSDADEIRDAKVECYAQLQELIYNQIGIMPTVRILLKQMQYFKQI